MVFVIPEKIKNLNPDEIDFNNEEVTKPLLFELLNLIETLAHHVAELEKREQELEDEINRLKGEKEKPKISSSTPKIEDELLDPLKDKEKKWTKTAKKPKIKIDRTVYREVDKKLLPPDAKHKGYREVVVQNIKFSTNNVVYVLERYYSESENKFYEATLPDEVNGEFGFELESFIIYLYYACRVTQNKIKKIMEEMGIIISEGQISNILIKKKKEEFTEEKEEIFRAGLNSSNYFHTDDTGMKHEGKKSHAHVFCNDIFSVFVFTPKKDRDTIKGILGLKTDEKIDKIMISDDASQYQNMAIYHALCWIHEIRLYKKLNPLLSYYRNQLIVFISRLWEFYDKLLEYRKNPNKIDKEKLEKEFDELFSTTTGYDDLDKRIALTKEKKEELLLVLKFPEILIHNNPAELALRELVVKRKISYGTRSDDGKKAWENIMSILDTCRKLGVSFLEYIKDILSGKYNMPRLAELILQKAAQKSTGY